jgi:hypothetical protein
MVRFVSFVSAKKNKGEGRGKREEGRGKRG